MRPPIDGGVALVTGTSSGIGLELARQLAPRVKALVLVARRKDRLEKLAGELKAKRPDLVVHIEAGDLSDKAFVDTLPARAEAAVGPIDVLVNNAGLGDFNIFDLTGRDKIDQMLFVNIVALTYLTRAILPGMIARGRGGILNVSSGMGLHFLPGFAVYSGTKHYVTAFTEILRTETRSTGVSVSQLCPGPVHTEFEEIASNIPGLSVPPFFEITAEHCVRSGLRGFSRGKALIVPGVLMWFAILFGGMVPRWLRRIVFAWSATRVRRLIAAQGARKG